MSKCNVCGELKMRLVFNQSAPCVSSVKSLVDSDMEVLHCQVCNHVQANNNIDLNTFYDVDYEISLDSDEHDQLHQDAKGNFVERTKLQAQILLNELSHKSDQKILEFGCGKASTLRHLNSMLNIDPYVFDVSDSYRKFWDTWITHDNQSTYSLPCKWNSKFDAICLHYVLEHVESPVDILRDLKSFLAPGGIVYISVPNFHKNIGDLFVVDHIQKFTSQSLEKLANLAGYSIKKISDKMLDSAWVAVLTAENIPSEATLFSQRNIDETQKFLSFGKEVLRAVDNLTITGNVAIFGAGFYGTLIASSQKENIVCFLDNNIHLSNSNLLDLPVYLPENCPDEVETVIFAVNPEHAAKIIRANSDKLSSNVKVKTFI